MAAAESGLTSTFNSPCAACKFLRRKCQPDCVFAPYFPPDQPNKFAHVHKVFGASNVTKLLNDLNPCQREDAVNSLAYEAEMRLRDPVYGCVGVIYALQHKLHQISIDLLRARLELVKHRPSSAASAASTLPIGTYVRRYMHASSVIYHKSSDWLSEQMKVQVVISRQVVPIRWESEEKD